MTYLSTDAQISFRNQLIILLIRGIYGIIVALTLYVLFSIDPNTILVLKNLFNDHYTYFVWLYLFTLYPISIAMVKMMVKTTKKYDLYLRGISIYFASAIITYAIISVS